VFRSGDRACRTRIVCAASWSVGETIRRLEDAWPDGDAHALSCDESGVTLDFLRALGAGYWTGRIIAALPFS